MKTSHLKRLGRIVALASGLACSRQGHGLAPLVDGGAGSGGLAGRSGADAAAGAPDAPSSMGGAGQGGASDASTSGDVAGTGGAASMGTDGGAGSGGGGSGGGGSGLTCLAGWTPCPFAGTSFVFCVQPESDPKNCGACGKVCPPQQICQAGTCGCPTEQAWCSAACVDEAIDPNNCGACGTTCSAAAPTCLAGKCACTGTKCGDVCVNEKTDATSCGACGTKCSDAAICSSGSCVSPPSCAPGGPGLSNCGLGGSGTESCCTTLTVPGGTFSQSYDLDVLGNLVVPADGGAANPSAPATVGGYRLDKYLVTVGRFRQFVNAWSAGWLPPAGSGKHAHLRGGRGLVNGGTAGAYEEGWVTDDRFQTNLPGGLACPDAGGPNRATWSTTASDRENLPINCVSWYEAYAFCIWDGGFLPTEAEWGYAAAGGNQQRPYGWGSTPPGAAGTYAVYCPQRSAAGTCTTGGKPAPVGSAMLGVGRWGQLDWGNVGEWGLDWFDYPTWVEPCVDCAELAIKPMANLTGEARRVVRGGSFDDDVTSLPAAQRFSQLPVRRYDTLGFRCARSP